VLLVVVALLVSSLFVGVGGLVERQQERAIGSQLETVGNGVAAALTRTGRLGNAGGTHTDVVVTKTLPDTVAGTQYLIDIDATAPPRYTLTLQSVEPELQTTVVLRSSVPIQETTVTGGRLQLIYDPATDRVEVHDAG
jgi:hypothetical protein